MGHAHDTPYTPIRNQLLDSSVWEADLRVRVLWVTLLVIANEPTRYGTIDITVRALAGRACMSPEDVRFALDALLSPDPASRNPQCEGRRLERLDEHRDWGWRIVNWDQYRTDRDRLYEANRKAKQRARHQGIEARIGALKKTEMAQAGSGTARDSAGHTGTERDARGLFHTETETETEISPTPLTGPKRRRPAGGPAVDTFVRLHKESHAFTVTMKRAGCVACSDLLTRMVDTQGEEGGAALYERCLRWYFSTNGFWKKKGHPATALAQESFQNEFKAAMAEGKA